MSLRATTWQTVGPYFHIGLERLAVTNIAGEGVEGERVHLRVRILDGAGAPIPDAIMEIWQANAHGKYAHPEDSQDRALEQEFRGFGRGISDDDGCLRFETIKPGPVPGPEGTVQAPHLVIGLMMRGLLKRLVTRMYFPNDPLNQSDPVLQLVDLSRRETLVPLQAPRDATVLIWEIQMQGERETVFFEF